MKLKVGVIGCRRGRLFMTAFNNHPDTTVEAICDSDKEELQAVAEEKGIENIFTDYRVMLKTNIDIVVIATPPSYHAEISVKALKAKKHVLCEVPAALTLKECELLVDTVQKTGMKYMMAENCRFYSVVEEMKKLKEKGKLGDIFYGEGEYMHDCRALFTNPDGYTTWRATFPPSSYLTHTSGPIMYILGERFVEVMAYGNSKVENRWNTNNLEVGLFRTEKGAIVKILNCFALSRPYLMYYSIYGSKGCVERTRVAEEPDRTYFSGEEEMMKPFIYQEVRPSPLNLPGTHEGSENVMVHEFIESILKDTTPPIDIYTAIDYTLPGICALDSIHKNQAVKIPHLQ
ncbi:MAG: Gfo/Idh/MocA family oxidoreductase [Candidatus Omnitrophota bacterium]